MLRKSLIIDSIDVCDRMDCSVVLVVFMLITVFFIDVYLLKDFEEFFPRMWNAS